MAATRKLQTEIQQVLKKLDEGVEIFDDIYEKVYAADTQALKEKFEADLKKEIKKLQRLRDQIKSWLSSSEIKDKNQLTEARKLIESKMESFKICEKDTKTKAYSKEGLAREAKLDPREVMKEEKRTWLNDCLDKLNDMVDFVEAEREKISATSKGKGKNKEALEKFDNRVQKHKWHMAKLELIIKLLDNDELEPSMVDGIQDSLDYYIESAADDDGATGVDDEFDIYEELQLDSHSLEISPKGGKAAGGEEDDEDAEGEESALAAAATTADKKKAIVAPAAVTAPVPPVVAGKTATAAKVSVTAPTGITSVVANKTPAVSAPKTVPVVAPAAAAPVFTSVPSAAPKANTKAPASTKSSTDDSVEEDVAAPVPAVSAPASGGMSWAAHAAASTAAASAPPTKPVAIPAQPAVVADSVPVPTPQPVQAAQPISQPTTPAVSAQPIPAIAPVVVAPVPAASPAPTPLSAPTAPSLPVAATPTVQQVAPGPPPKSSSELLQIALNQLRYSMHFTPENLELEKQSNFLNYTPRNYYGHMHSSFPTTPQFSSEKELGELYERLPMDTLFFIFYFQQGTYQQYLAARQLKKHSWRFHKKYMTWFQRHEEPKIATEEYEEGTYVYFDYESGWCQRIKSEFKFEYAYLEDEMGVLPSTNGASMGSGGLAGINDGVSLNIQ